MVAFSKSLNTKLLLIVTLFLVVAGALVAFIQSSMRVDALKAQRDAELRQLARYYSDNLSSQLQHHESVFSGLSESFSRRYVQSLLSVPPIPTLKQSPLQFDADGALRYVGPGYGFFYPSSKTHTQQVLLEAEAAKRSWLDVIPVANKLFDAVYFISEQGLSVVSPANIAELHGHYHNVQQEVFYTVATPTANPQRQQRWTEAYYDAYIGKWMISTLMPIYQNDTFLGVFGADVNLSRLIDLLEGMEFSSQNHGAVLFDENGKVILLHGYNEDALDVEHESYQSLDGLEEADYQLARYIQSILGQSGSNIGTDIFKTDRISILDNTTTVGSDISDLSKIDTINIGGAPHYITYNSLADIDWKLALFYPQRLISDEVASIRNNIFENSFYAALLLAVSLFYVLKYFVTRRIKRLAESTALINDKNWSLTVPSQGTDEISLLGVGINQMLNKINGLVVGLNANIEQLEAASLQSKKLISAVEHSSCMVFVLNADWSLDYANPYYWEVSGIQKPSPDAVTDAFLTNKGRGATLRANIQNTLSMTDEWQGEYMACRDNGQEFWVMMSVNPVFNASGNVQYYVCTGQDISDIKYNQQRMEQLAYYDQLTGLQNRTLFKRELKLALLTNSRENNQLALLYLDLDHFKRVNDTLGHESGDYLLQEVASRLRSCLREEDAIARLGGDEFAILLQRIGSPRYASLVAEKVIAALNEPILLAGQELVIGVSVGITLAPHDSTVIDTLMKNADLAMYQAKGKGRNSHQFYTVDMNIEMESRLLLERELREAIDNFEFELYFQPQMDVESGDIVGAEALLRWNHPVKGRISPAEFIPIAEESGLIVPIGKWALRVACQQARSIQKALARQMRISVNLSMRQLHDENFVDELQAILKDTGLQSSQLELEVTESMLMVDAHKVVKLLTQIRKLGVHIAIDDFGTGYSSLSYLKKLPLSCLKVDRSFVKDLPEDAEDKAITSMIVAMANSLGHSVIAEGVEKTEQLQYLRDNGCDVVQGYLICHPIPANDLMLTLFEWDGRAVLAKLLDDTVVSDDPTA